MTKALPISFDDFVATIARLRDPDKGCPWDLKQTFGSLRRYMLEEAYEACAVMGSDQVKSRGSELLDELGDVLLQVVLNAQLAKDEGMFTINDVVRNIDEKMRRRHPHVFGHLASEELTVAEIHKNWDAIKADERKKIGVTDEPGIFQKVAKGQFPATLQALAIGKKAKEIAFDWDKPSEVLTQFQSEVSELAAAVDEGDPKAISDELGDVYFSLAQLCRHLGVDPEAVAQQGNLKFLERFAKMESIACEAKIDILKTTRDEKEALWLKAKLTKK